MEDQVDFEAIGRVQQQTWSEGDFAMVAHGVMMVAEELAEALEILPDERVLDVACGSGNGALAAARRAWGNTVGVDFVPELLATGRERAAAERLDVDFVEGDATALPFGDGEFDIVTSIFGAMFAADQQRAADELLRACRSGGRIGMANWTPDSAVGELFGTVAKHAPPPEGAPSPLAWGTEEHLRELFGDRISDLRIERRRSRQGFRSSEHFVEFFRTYFGPIKSAFERIGPEGEEAFKADLIECLERNDTSNGPALIFEPEYLQVIATRA